MADKKIIPGSIFSRGGRFYWRVRLPGAEKHQTIRLVPPGGKLATSDPQVARHLAGVIYRAAMREAAPSTEDPTVSNLTRRYLAHCREYYQISHEAQNIEYGLDEFAIRYGSRAAAEIGPLVLQEFMMDLIASEKSIGGKARKRKLARSTINRWKNFVCRMYRWAAAQEILSVSCYQALATVENLKPGRTAARECEKITPVAEEHVLNLLPFIGRIPGAMMKLQMLTGMRPGEACILRPRNLNQQYPIWVYTPDYHKTQWRGKSRKIPIGPRAQKILLPFLGRDLNAFCFSPFESERERRAELHEARQTPPDRGNRPGTNRKPYPKYVHADHYTSTSYRKAVCNALNKVNAIAEADALAEKPNPQKPIPHFTPLQIRHTLGTRVRREFGIEHEAAVLGHSDVATSKIYAELDRRLAWEVAEKIG